MTTQTEGTNMADNIVEQALTSGGVFKGANGLRGLAEARAFWDKQAYGTRLYYGDGIADYLHHGVLTSAIKTIETQADELDRLRTELAALREQLETERIRLAACGVVAMSNTPESAAKAREMLPIYWSASCGDVEKAVDREMALRTELASARVDAEREFLEQWLQFAATPIGQECCGFGRDEECCGDPSPVYNSADQVLSAMGARHHEITAAISQVQP